MFQSHSYQLPKAGTQEKVTGYSQSPEEEGGYRTGEAKADLKAEKGVQAGKPSRYSSVGQIYSGYTQLFDEETVANAETYVNAKTNADEDIWIEQRRKRSTKIEMNCSRRNVLCPLPSSSSLAISKGTLTSLKISYRAFRT